MAVVPITKNSPPPAQAAPPEAALLMALSEMHKQGRFKPKPSVIPTAAPTPNPSEAA